LTNYKETKVFDKSKCIYDLIKFIGESQEAIELVMFGILKNLNEMLSEKIQLNDKQMIFIIQAIIENRNGITIKHFEESVKRGIIGEYGPVYRFDITTIIPWIDAYHEANYNAYVENERLKRKTDNLANAASGDMAELMKAALKRTEKRAPIKFDDPEYLKRKANYEANKPKLSDGEGTIPPEGIK